MTLNNLNSQERFVYEWQYSLAGDFNTALAEVFTKADIKNFHRLSKAFPDEGTGMYNYLNTPRWWENVQKKVQND